jgi:hypothetical protein
VEASKKRQTSKNSIIRLQYKISSQRFRQAVDDFELLMVFEDFLDLFFLPQVAFDFHLKLWIDSICLGQSFKSCNFTQILLISQSHGVNDISNL